ncbi:hypothetical protein Gpo141_00012290 [Globisporangium polare]
MKTMTPLHRDRFSVLTIAQELLLPTALARRLVVPPTHVYHQVFKGESGIATLPHGVFVSQDLVTQVLYGGSFWGCECR